MATKKNVRVGNNEYYRIRRTINGKVRSFYGRSKHDAERKYLEYLAQLDKEKNFTSVATIHDRAKEYIENSLSVSQRYANGTKRRYRLAYTAHIEGTDFDKKVATDVKAADIQKFYNRLDVSAQTLKQIHKFMSGFWKWMVLNEYASNAIVAVEIPVKPDTKRHDGIEIWGDDEIQAILQGIDACTRLCVAFRQAFLVRVLLYTGVRIGEALSLKYTDFRDGNIYIDRQVYLGEIKPPKYNSQRVIPMHEELAQALEQHRAWHKTEMKEKGYDTPFVFTTKKGTLYSAENVRYALNCFYDKIGVPRRKIHAYRSTFCTQLCRCDVPLEVASKLLGHKSLEVTSQHYLLVRKDTIDDAIQRLTYFS